ncbi:MAG: AI-2E family transporter [Polyangia bacterium]
MTGPNGGRWPTPRRAALLTIVVVLVFGILRALVVARTVLLLGFLAVVLATVLRFPIDLLSRWIKRGIAVLITFAAFVGLLVAIGFLVAPRLQSQLEQLPGEIASARDQIADWWLKKTGDPGAAAQKLARQAPEQAVQHALPIAYSAAEMVSAAVGITVLAFFLAAEGDDVRRSLCRLVPLKYEQDFEAGWRRAGAALRHWTVGIAVSMTIMGVLTGLGLWIAGVRTPFLLGLVTFFGTFIPYLGALASAIPGLAVALSQSPRRMFWALIVYLLVHHVEGYVVQPMVMRRAARLTPSLLLLWEAVMGAVFGLAGVVVATPLLAVVYALVQYGWIERALGRVPEGTQK